MCVCVCVGNSVSAIPAFRNMYKREKERERENSSSSRRRINDFSYPHMTTTTRQQRKREEWPRLLCLDKFGFCWKKAGSQNKVYTLNPGVIKLQGSGRSNVQGPGGVFFVEEDSLSFGTVVLGH